MRKFDKPEQNFSLRVLQVAEAKARKRRRVAQKTEQARGKAEQIVDNEDMGARSKAKEIGKLYANAHAAGRGKRGGKKAEVRSCDEICCRCCSAEAQRRAHEWLSRQTSLFKASLLAGAI
jgi:Spb1 C-terminal domain